jgi:dsDNA-specific endonuclease/ATPase MutS2
MSTIRIREAGVVGGYNEMAISKRLGLLREQFTRTKLQVEEKAVECLR